MRCVWVTIRWCLGVKFSMLPDVLQLKLMLMLTLTLTLMLMLTAILVSGPSVYDMGENHAQVPKWSNKANWHDRGCFATLRGGNSH
uniref:Uncharacterized protein n=1 Tax=Candidatus Kentrum sp. LFY TaxID=2126342 RepID=A0A450U540_9GAMM|nr:MAG: hypothetical protein BECKLFY1418B_GA0070995_100227 [Candidatus Kentron sp. LFY]